MYIQDENTKDGMTEGRSDGENRRGETDHRRDRYRA